MRHTKEKTFIQVTGIIFSIITLLQLARVIYGWQANIGGWTVPMEISYFAILVGGYFAYSSYKLLQ